MAVTEQVTCDLCGTVKGEANHWILWDMDSHLRFMPWGDMYRQRGHLCGEACAGKMLAKAIGEWRMAASAPHSDAPAEVSDASA